MIRSRLFGAASFALLLAACSGQQTEYDSTTGAAPGELPPAAETTPATSPDIATTPPVDSTASTEATESTEAATMGDAATDTPVTDPDEPVQNLPPNPARNPDPMAEEPPQDRQDSTSPPPPVQ